MTKPIAFGDLVLRDGRAEGPVMEVWFARGDLRYSRPSWQWTAGEAPAVKDATRIGSTHDGWRVHTCCVRPESVGPDDFVEAVWNHGQRLSRPESAGTLPWGDVGGERIVAYLVVPRPQVDAQPDHSAVAAELRAIGARGDRDIVFIEIEDLANRLDPPKLQPLKPGNVVNVNCLGRQAQVDSGPDHNGNWTVSWHKEGGLYVLTCPLSELERA